MRRHRLYIDTPEFPRPTPPPRPLGSGRSTTPRFGVRGKKMEMSATSTAAAPVAAAAPPTKYRLDSGGFAEKKQTSQQQQQQQQQQPRRPFSRQRAIVKSSDKYRKRREEERQKKEEEEEEENTNNHRRRSTSPSNHFDEETALNEGEWYARVLAAPGQLDRVRYSSPNDQRRHHYHHQPREVLFGPKIPAAPNSLRAASSTNTSKIQRPLRADARDPGRQHQPLLCGGSEIGISFIQQRSLSPARDCIHTNENDDKEEQKKKNQVDEIEQEKETTVIPTQQEQQQQQQEEEEEEEEEVGRPLSAHRRQAVTTRLKQSRRLLLKALRLGERARYFDHRVYSQLHGVDLRAKFFLAQAERDHQRRDAADALLGVTPYSARGARMIAFDSGGGLVVAEDALGICGRHISAADDENENGQQQQQQRLRKRRPQTAGAGLHTHVSSTLLEKQQQQQQQQQQQHQVPSSSSQSHFNETDNTEGGTVDPATRRRTAPRSFVSPHPGSFRSGLVAVTRSASRSFHLMEQMSAHKRALNFAEVAGGAGGGGPVVAVPTEFTSPAMRRK